MIYLLVIILIAVLFYESSRVNIVEFPKGIPYVVLGNGDKWKEHQEKIKHYPRWYRYLLFRFKYLIDLFIGHDLGRTTRMKTSFLVLSGKDIALNVEKTVSNCEGVMCHRCNYLEPIEIPDNLTSREIYSLVYKELFKIKVFFDEKA
jgi:hypothetical protein